MKIVKKLSYLSLSVLLIMCFILNAYATSASNTVIDADHCSECIDGIEMLDPESLIDALSIEELEAQNCIARRSDLESDLNTVVYECADGNYVAYIFQYPIKYIDSSGKTKDISTSIKSTSTIKDNSKNRLAGKYEYASVENDINVFYSQDISNSEPTILASNEYWNIGLSPYGKLTGTKATTVPEVSTSSRDNTTTFAQVQYSNVFQNNISLSYQTTYTGYKELIIINAPTETNVFQFILNSGGLIPTVTEEGEIQLHDTNENLIASFAPLYVYDSSDEPLFTLDNSYDVQVYDEEENTYLITLNIDKTFLTSSEITYPIVIDPTFNFNVSSSIDDAPIYSGRPSRTHGANYYNCLGYLDSTYGVGSLLLKFPALKNSAFFNSLPDSRINSVTFNARKSGGGTASSATVAAYRYIGASWDETTVTYNSANISSNTGVFVTSVSLQSNKWYSFNITSAALAWKNGTASYDSGLVLKNTTNSTDSSYERVLASIEYGQSVDSSYMPYVEVVFNTGNASGAFNTADQAAKDFAESVYSFTQYSRIEYGATLYKYNGKYYYYNVHSGKPHSVPVSKNVPNGATYIAYLHTHPNSEDFSAKDKEVADAWGGYAYVATKSYKVLRYNSDTQASDTIYSSFTPYALTQADKDNILLELETVWYSHLENGACPGCQNKTWPNE